MQNGATAKRTGGQGYRTIADFWGMALSLLCLIHCLLLPVLLSFAPELLRSLPGDDATHRMLMPLVGLVGWIAFRGGYRLHRKRRVLVMFFVGVILITIPAILGESILSVTGEIGITICGSLLLVTAHWVNRSFCRSCIVQGCEHHLPLTEEAKLPQAIED